MIDAVLSYHMNPATCGVAKFNHALAKRLGVPVDEFCCEYETVRRYHPLISIKPGEIVGFNFPRQGWGRYSLFLHGFDSRAVQLIEHAQQVYAGSQEIANWIRPYRSDVITAFCPSTIQGDPTRGAYRVLVFGMAHKLVLKHFEDLKVELDRDHPDYTIELSTAVHEGNPWDEALAESTEAMRGIFGDRLRVLGFLADDALARVLTEVDAVAAFYVPALRANNTTAWAALSAGKFLYTNLDEHSPELNPEKYSWDALLKVLA